jgi:outer membrane cobalamin receptor
MLAFALATVVAAASPSPSPSPAPNEIARVQVATGHDRALHALPLPAAVLPIQAAHDAASSTDAVLRALPGYDRGRDNAYFSNYGLNRVSIGGAGNDRGAAFVDGVPAQDPFGGQVDWAAYPAFALTRGEIAIGPGSALYGSGAIGGALALRSANAAIAPGPSGFAELTEGTLVQTAAALANVPIDRTFAIGGWGQTSRSSFDALPPAYRYAGSTDAVSVDGTTRLSATYANGGLSATAGTLFSTDAQQEGRPNYTFSRSLRQVDLAAGFASGASSWTLRAFDRGSDLINASDAFPSKPGVLLYTQSVPDSDNGESLSFTRSAGPAALFLQGGSYVARGYSRQTGPAGGLQDLGSGEQSTTFGVAQAELDAARLSFVAGARFDAIATSAVTLTAGRDLYDAALSPRAALSYAFGDRDLVVRAYGGTGLRVPYLNELVRSYRIGAITYAPSLALSPERSSGEGVGIDFARGGARFSLTAQSLFVSDALDFRTISPTLQIRSNVGSTRTDGLIASLSVPLSCGALNASAQGYNARVTSDVDPRLIGKRVPYVPNEQASAEWTTGRTLTAAVSLTYLGTSFADDINVQPLGSALIAGAIVSIPAGAGALSLGASNLANAQYATSPDRLGPPSGVFVRFTTARRSTPCGAG